MTPRALCVIHNDFREVRAEPRQAENLDWVLGLGSASWLLVSARSQKLFRFSDSARFGRAGELRTRSRFTLSNPSRAPSTLGSFAGLSYMARSTLLQQKREFASFARFMTIGRLKSESHLLLKLATSIHIARSPPRSLLVKRFGLESIFKLLVLLTSWITRGLVPLRLPKSSPGQLSNLSSPLL
jgi:hypothetical protein